MPEISNDFFKLLGLPCDTDKPQIRDPYRMVRATKSPWNRKLFNEDGRRDGIKRLYVRHAIQFDDQKANHDQFYDRCWLVLKHSICREWCVLRLWSLTRADDINLMIQGS